MRRLTWKTPAGGIDAKLLTKPPKMISRFVTADLSRQGLSERR